MDEILLNLFLGLVVVVAIYGAGRWAVRMEQRAHERNLSSRVYYPRRGGTARSRVPAPGQGGSHAGDGAPSKD